MDAAEAEVGVVGVAEGVVEGNRRTRRLVVIRSVLFLY